MKNTKEKDWFDSPGIVTYIIIALLIVLIILSQSFAIQNHLSAAEIVRSILNNNSIYVLTLIYFVLLRFHFGKKYFDYLNVLMAIFFFLLSVAGLFTIFQSFSLTSLLSFALHVLLLVYFIYAFICNTVIGKEIHLATSPLAELKNNQYFYLISSLIAVLLVVSLIDSTSFEGVVLILLESIFYFLFARYIYLYYEYSNSKLINEEKEVKEVKEKQVEKEEKPAPKENAKKEKTKKNEKEGDKA